MENVQTCDCGKPSRGTSPKARQCWDCLPRTTTRTVPAVHCPACGTAAGYDCRPGAASGITNCPRRSFEMAAVTL